VENNLSERREKPIGRPQAIDDESLQAVRNHLVQLLEKTWGSVGWSLPRIKTQADIFTALSSWGKYREHYVVDTLLRESDGEATAEELWALPDHWRSFRGRRSPISGSQRLAADPLNAMLNYLYALLESEARLAVAALGLDPGLGFLHLDSRSRDSLASDVMEPVRPLVDAFVLDWIARAPLRRKWFFEQADGNCRLMGSFTQQLSETLPIWRVAVAPFAERVTRILWQSIRKSHYMLAPPTRLTQRHKREAKGAPSLPVERKPRPQNICQGCGSHISKRKKYCVSCGVATSTERLLDVAQQGRIIAVSPEVNARRAEKTRGHNLARWGWAASSQPAWLTNEFYETKIQPRLANIPRSTISNALGVSKTYASEIRAGKSLPHPRHWQNLAKLVGVSA
jgi:ribosomal protein L37E